MRPKTRKLARRVRSRGRTKRGQRTKPHSTRRRVNLTRIEKRRQIGRKRTPRAGKRRRKTARRRGRRKGTKRRALSMRVGGSHPTPLRPKTLASAAKGVAGLFGTKGQKSDVSGQVTSTSSGSLADSETKNQSPSAGKSSAADAGSLGATASKTNPRKVSSWGSNELQDQRSSIKLAGKSLGEDVGMMAGTILAGHLASRALTATGGDQAGEVGPELVAAAGRLGRAIKGLAAFGTATAEGTEAGVAGSGAADGAEGTGEMIGDGLEAAADA